VGEVFNSRREPIHVIVEVPPNEEKRRRMDQESERKKTEFKGGHKKKRGFRDRRVTVL